MVLPTNQELNTKREKHCIAITHERKYYHVGDTWIKRSLRPSEWQKRHDGLVHEPLFNKERILNEGACLKFIADQTDIDIPIPKLHACFEDDGAAYVITEYVEGVGMNEIPAHGQRHVVKELQFYKQALRGLKSDTWGGLGGMVLPPYRIMRNSNGQPWIMCQREKTDLVFCHNDLSMHNIIVDPETFKINAIIDWEYAGFYPAEFEMPFYLRPGPSVALTGEADDVETLTALMARERLAGPVAEA